MSINVIKKNNINIVGNPDAAETIVFGHGFGSSQEAFNYMLPHFEKDYRIVLYDNMGVASLICRHSMLRNIVLCRDMYSTWWIFSANWG
ncbi:hypothetical protein MKQ70_10225 [Chitinophaga sedimenti]|uniref:alpha/beta fold hydrolase n=1 Tax=Chitinophaga sedimenti TaxID=2033606 RepID=UPI0020032A91|nr:hypothetical protein [Chitinophaga sedimenti]MCK7555357.1 hypothetical protein [Chitinophaga sedimenti]